MGVFDSFKDSPFGIRTEGQTIEITFTKTGPTTARISWNLPVPAIGCSSDDLNYNGIVITLDTQAVSFATTPTDKTVYTSDPTANVNLHAGDKIGTALVVGAFYNDKTTTFLDISGLSQNVGYFVSGYAVDAVNRYHREGVHSYSLPFGDSGTRIGDANGFQIFEFPEGSDVVGTDPTSLPLLQFLDLKFVLNADNIERTITINTSLASTYADLIVEINKQFALLDNPFQGPVAPNTNAFFVDAPSQDLFQWNGNQHIQLPVIFEAIPPNVQVVDDYWYDKDDNKLYKWDGVGWSLQSIIRYYQDPTNLQCDDYWFDGTKAYNWTGNVWDRKTLYNQTIDPSLDPNLPCCTFWFDPSKEVLYKWNTEACTGVSGPDWTTTLALTWPIDPTTVVNDTFWFDETVRELKQWNGFVWSTIPVTISSTQPSFPIDLSYWFNPQLQELKQYNQALTTFVDIDFILWPTDPRTPSSGDLWWKTSDDTLYQWDELTNSWIQVCSFFIQQIDPSLPLVIQLCDLWVNSDDQKLRKWDGSGWLEVTFINHPTNPLIPSTTVHWFDTTNNVWYAWDGFMWTQIMPTETPEDPYVPTTGDFWYDTTNDTLFQWNGAAWVPMIFSTTPLTPTVGNLWFDSSNNILYRWNGVSYVEEEPKVSASLFSGDVQNLLPGIKFVSLDKEGSASEIIINGDPAISTLLPALIPAGTLGNAFRGADLIAGIPMTQVVGIGTDGSVDERRELMDTIRRQLGYPTVTVELDQYQLDFALQQALETIREQSSVAYRRQFYFLYVPLGQQHFFLADKKAGFDKIVAVSIIYRARYSLQGHGGFIGTNTTGKQGQGFSGANDIFTQAFYQYMFGDGYYDLTTYHALGEYLETMNHLFATDVTFNFNERTRLLRLYNRFFTNEHILLDCVVERTENDLLTDRYTKTWIQKYALAEAMEILSNIRGKFASLPGAGGGISLNAAELRAAATEQKQQSMDELANFVTEQPEEFGGATTFILG